MSAQSNTFANPKKHIQRVHPASLAAFEEVLLQNRKTYKQAESPLSSVQPSIRAFCGQSGAVSQSVVNSACTQFIIKSGQAFTLVRQDAFREFFKTIQPAKNLHVPCYETVIKQVKGKFEEMKSELKDHLSSAKYICTTADAWSEGHRAYLGMTVHTLDEDLNRHSFGLACRRIKGSQTHDVLAEALESIHSEFHIQGKVTGTVTDNGRNFCKAFDLFGEIDLVESRDEIEDEAQDMEFVDVETMLEEAEQEGIHHLPPHHRCAAHTINLIATKDADKALKSSATFARLSRSVFGKCQAMWNMQSRSSQFADKVDSTFKLYFVVPNSTRWNSIFNSMNRIKWLLALR